MINQIHEYHYLISILIANNQLIEENQHIKGLISG